MNVCAYVRANFIRKIILHKVEKVMHLHDVTYTMNCKYKSCLNVYYFYMECFQIGNLTESAQAMILYNEFENDTYCRIS